MTSEERRKIVSNDYADFIGEYKRFDKIFTQFANDTLNIIDERFGVIYFPFSRATTTVTTEAGYSAVPKLYGLLDTLSLEEMGVTRIQNLPNFALRGSGVLLGFVDTGIDYTNPLFMNEDKTSRIISIWDQTIDNFETSDQNFNYGTVYSREQINEALKNDNPYSVVPSKDENGHGTMIAGISGGNVDESNNFQGVVPLSELVVVKLKPAKKIIRDFFYVSDSAVCYQENDIMFGIQYLSRVASQLKRPIVICIALGSNQGGHDGVGFLGQFIASKAVNTSQAVVVAAGNEGNSKHHYYGTVKKETGYDTVELKVGQEEKGFTMEIWGDAPATYSIDILSPSGEYIPQIIARLGENRVIRFLFENTVIYVDYLLVEALSGDPLILVRFNKPAAGIWRFRVYASGNANQAPGFHIWLPLTGFISEETSFVQPNPDTTITSPGNGAIAITVTAYNASTKSIYLQASRGYTRDNRVKPDVAAPGVDVLGPNLEKGFQRYSGTSVAAAHVTGISAMLFEWGIVNGNFATMSGRQIQRFLIRGVQRDSQVIYPNKTWGYGRVDIYNTFLSLRSSSP